MLDGRYPSQEFGELRPRIVWDRVAGHDPRAQGRARSSRSRTRARSPTAACSPSSLPDGRRVGELDEEMVYEARPGPDVPARRVVVADRGDRPRPRHRHPRAGRAGRRAVLEGRLRRAPEGARARRSARSAAGPSTRPPRTLEARLRPRPARRAQPPRLPARAAGGHARRARATARSSSSASATRSATGGCASSRPYGGRVHAAWGARAVSARIRDEFGLESDAIWSDDGIIVHLPDADEPPGADLVLLEPDELEDARRRRAGGSSALFGARFRENAGRALLIPRAYPGKRTPLWQQRLKSQSLLEVAKRYADFPIILETYRECLRDVLDLPGLRELLTRAAPPRALARRGRDADRLAVRLLAAVRLRRDVHVRGRHAERRAARGRALARPRPAARAARPGGAARAHRPGALEQVEADLQHRSERTRAATRDALHDVLRRVGDLTAAEVARPRASRASTPTALLADARARAPRVRAARRRRGALDRRRRRRPLPRRARRRPARRPARGVPRRRPTPARARSPRRYARTHGPFTTAELRARYGVDPTSALRGARARRRRSCAASCAPAAREREWCDPEVLRRLRRASLAVLRKEIEAADQRALAALPAVAGRASTAIRPAGAGVDRLREVLVPLQGLALPADVWERDVLPRRVGAYSPTWMDQLCASGEVVWVGAGALGRNSGRVALYFREDAEAIGPPPCKGEPPAEPRARRAARAAGARRRASSPTCSPSSPLAPEELQEALWDLVWAGEVTNDAWAPLRAPRLTLARAQRVDARATGAAPAAASASRRSGAQAQVQGRWSLTDAAVPPRARARRSAAARSPSCCSSATASSPASRCWPRAIPGGFSIALRRARRSSRRSASAAAATSSRASAARSSRCPGAVERLRARRRGRGERRRSCSPRPTRPSPTARRCRGRSATASTASRQRVAGAYVVLAGAEPVLYVERGGKRPDVPRRGRRPAPAPGARGARRLRAPATASRRLSLERVDGEPVVGSDVGDRCSSSWASARARAS